jgi:uncharacterized membrane protein (DUF106 family)
LDVTGFFTLILKPFENGYATAGIVFISIITGTVMLFLFKLTSNQEAMKEVKAKIGAYFLEMRLYKEDISAVMDSQRRILAANMRYMKLALIPAAVMIVPVILIMVQLNLRYSQVSLNPGDTAIVKVKVEDGVDVVGEGMTLSVGRGLEKASPAVRIASLGETDWKIRLAERGVHDLTLKSGSGEVTLPVFGTDKLLPVFAVFKKGSFLETILNPGAPRIPKAMRLASVEVKYPSMDFNWGIFRLSWLWSFLIISMAFGFILKFVLKVE